METEPRWVTLYNGFNNGIDPSKGVGGKVLDLQDYRLVNPKKENMETTIERIKKDALDYAKSIEAPIVNEKYIAKDFEKGAISERNKTIEEAKQTVKEYFAYLRIIDLEEDDIIERLERLKIDLKG